MGKPSKKAIAQKKELLMSYHLQGYTVAEMASQFNLTEATVVKYLTDTVTAAGEIELVEKKQARQVELLRLNFVMKKLTAEFSNAVDCYTDKGALTRDSVKATVAISNAILKVVDIRAKLLDLYTTEGVIGKQNQNRLLALDYEHLSDQELASLYANALNSSKNG